MSAILLDAGASYSWTTGVVKFFNEREAKVELVLVVEELLNVNIGGSNFISAGAERASLLVCYHKLNHTMTRSPTPSTATLVAS